MAGFDLIFDDYFQSEWREVREKKDENLIEIYSSKKWSASPYLTKLDGTKNFISAFWRIFFAFWKILFLTSLKFDKN